jgi:hypothetical protein
MKTPKLFSLFLLFALSGSSAILLGCLMSNRISMPLLAAGEALVFLLAAAAWFAERSALQAEKRRVVVPIKNKQNQVVVRRCPRRW